MSRGTLLLYNVIGWITGTITVYLITHLVLWLFDKKGSIIRKLVFSFIVGPLFENAWTYLIFYVFKINFLSELAPILHTLPVPLLAFVCYFSGIKILKIPHIKTPRVMTVYYLCYLITIKFSKFLYLLILSDIRLNFNLIIMNLTGSLTFMVVLALLNIFASKIFKKIKSITMSNDEFFFNSRKDIMVYIFNSFFTYVIVILINLSMNSQSFTNLVAGIVISMFLVAYILMDYKKIIEADNENKSAHVKMLIEGTNDFRSIKHDFYNILQTYEGYLIIGDIERLRKYHSNLMHVTLSAGSSIELSKKMEQNPALISLLTNKSEYAEQMNVQMRISIQASLENFNINNIDLCRCLSCLIDNAIEAAIESNDKRVHFSIEQKANGGRLVIINNSTAAPVDVEKSFSFGATTKENHDGIGLATVKKILEKYPHCMFKMSYYNLEVNTYIEIKDL